MSWMTLTKVLLTSFSNKPLAATNTNTNINTNTNTNTNIDTLGT